MLEVDYKNNNNKMKYTKIYIGSNNKTGEVEIVKALGIIESLGNCGYTSTLGRGYWENKREQTLVIEIYGDYNTGIIPELKRELKQDSILVVEQLAEVKFL